MNSSQFDANNAKKLLDLHISWEKLIRARNNARLGSQVRRELDAIYFKALPTIVDITKAADDSEVVRLVQVAGSLLK